MYIELHAASAFSFLEGASLPESLVDRAAELGYTALALVDRDGLYGAPRFHKAALAAGLKPIVGCELTIGDRGSGIGDQGSGWRLPVLVESREGYRNLCRLVTRMKLRSPKGEGALALDDFDGHTAGLVALAGREALSAGRHGVGGLVDRLVGLFGRGSVYLELQRHRLRDEEADNRMLADLAGAFHVPLIATGGVRFARPDDRPLFDLLTCIRHRTDLRRAGRRLAANAERDLKPPAEMAALFADYPAAVAATSELGARLQYTMADLGYRFPAYPVPEGETLASFLRKITDLGARERYRPYHDRARRQVERELALIEKLGLPGYFLIVWDLINFCRRQGILAQGRGSAANSAVCYSLGITAVDPVGMELLFERFLSEERGEWPDIDLDLPSGDQRERVIQYVYEKYGRHGAAMTANVITYRGRSAAREVGKALGVEAALVDRLSKVMNHFESREPGDVIAGHLRDLGVDGDDPRLRLFADLWRRIQDLPRHLGQHSGGMVVCEGALDAVVPLENASMPGRVVVQWDKDDCADMGIVKIDLLGLGMMAALEEALSTINRQRPGQPPLGLWNLPPDDPEVYRLLQRADTMGVFQVESRAQMATLPRLRPERFYDIVVEVAIIRPGPIVGNMVHPYMNRRAGREPVVYPHPSLEPILKRTLGVPLFQEQLLRIAMVAAGFTGGQAEDLRRAFGFKRSERRMAQVEVQLREGMARNGITGEAADQIVKSITSFALYGFPESHAASFALLVYASAYLKVHYPAAFYAALLNGQPMGFYHPATLVKEAQRRGVRFAPVDVQRSGWPCTVEADGTVRLGLRYVSGLRREVAERMGEGRDRESGIGDRGSPHHVGSGFSRNIGAEDRGSGNGDRGSPHHVGSGFSRNIGAEDRGSGNGDQARGGGGRPFPRSAQGEGLRCPKCGSDDPSMIEVSGEEGRRVAFCNTCACDWRPDGPGAAEAVRFRSLEEIAARTGATRAELERLAEVGALNAFGYHRREALWQVERAVRPPGELFEGLDQPADACPLLPMTPVERVVADYEGTSLTLGPHPMAIRRGELALRGVLRSADLARQRHGRRVRVAGAVITRQRPGTAKGFVFLTLEDETGIANVIVRPDLFARQKLAIIEEPFLLVDGLLQNQEGVTSVRADNLEGLGGTPVAVESHDFY